MSIVKVQKLQQKFGPFEPLGICFTPNPEGSGSFAKNKSTCAVSVPAT